MMKFSIEEVLGKFEEYLINERIDISLINIYEIINSLIIFLKTEKIDYFIATERGFTDA